MKIFVAEEQAQFLYVGGSIRTKYMYENGEKTDKIAGYAVPLVHLGGQFGTPNVVFPIEPTLEAGSVIKVQKLAATPYVSNNFSQVSFKGDSLEKIKDIDLSDSPKGVFANE